jgi:hypothetical protein
MASDIIQLSAFMVLGGQPAQNVWHFRGAVAPDPNPDTEAQKCINGWRGTIETAWLLCMPGDVVVHGYKARRVNNGGGPTVILPTPGVVGSRTPGFSAGAIGPCLIWGYSTLTRWRAGRTFVCGVAEDDIEENVFGAGIIGACDALIALMLGTPAFTDGGVAFKFTIYQRGAALASDVETGTVSGKPGVQNRRMKPTF